MEPGGTSSTNANDCYYAGFARVPAGGGQAGALLGWVAAEASRAGAAHAAPCWRRGLRESGPPRGLHRVVTAFAPCANIKLLERDLSKERHELLKDQRLFRDRARKHFVETNKRRRALEEKWKEEEEKEQKFREQILLQRKLKHQQATERFQRGHLSSSQHKRGVPTKPKLDEALNQIKETGLQLPSSRANGRTFDMSSTPTKNGPLLWKQNPAKTVCDTIMQENSRANLASDQRLFQQNLEEMQQQLQAQHFSNLRDFHQEVHEITHSESVCSVDSLDAGEPNENYAIPSEASSLSTQLDASFHNSQESQNKNKTFSDETDMIFSKAQHVNNWLINLNTTNIQTTSPFRDILIKYNVVPADEDTRSPEQKSSVPNTSEQGETERCSSDVNLTFAQNKDDDKSSLLKCSSSGTINTEGLLATDRPVCKFNRAWTTPDSCSIASKQEKNSELPQNNNASLAQGFSKIAATPVVLPIGEWSSTATYNNSFLENYLQKGKEAHAASFTEDAACIRDVNTEKYLDHVNNEMSLFEEPCKDSLDQQKDNREGKVAEVVLTVPHGDFTDNLSDFDVPVNDNTNERKGEKLPKSILKKESKYEPGSFKAVVVNRGIRFGNQSVSLARDSIELAKTKGKDVDSQKNYKKLRWFDEINREIEANDEEKCSEQSITEIPQAQPPSPGFQIKTTMSKTNLRSVPSCTINSVFTDSHQEPSQTSAKLPTAGGSEGDTGTVKPFVSTAYHVAKQAWIAPKSEETKPLCNNDPKMAKSSSRKGRTKMTKRPKSAKAPSSFIPKNRKGTIIRPQSANEATTVLKTQGKLMVPHPPCKSIPGKKTDENPDAACQAGNPCKLPADTENSHCANGRHPSPEDQDSSRDATADPSLPSAVCHSHNVTMRPSYSIFTYEPLTLTKRNANTAQPVSSCSSFTKRSLVYSENGLRPDRTPTDEEIAVLWQGVHRALAPKDGAAGDSQHYITHCINSNSSDLQLTKPNVSHITIDGGSLTGNIKSGVRVNGVFSSQPSAAVVMARRKSNEHSENKRKALLEQRRQMTSSACWKPSNVGQNMVKAMKLGPFQCTYEPVQAKGGSSHSDEVSDSTTQFLLAENLANTGATEDEILTGLDAAQPHKKNVVVNRAQRQGMSALSLEEHRVLQSLERINQKLQSVQGTISKNLSTTSVLQTISPLVTSPSYVDITSPIQKYRSISADARALMQKRY
ncbi:centrosomal protein of 126 kDa [Tiliqua scincoides]|uniref:centrosomal protein of 126 kDa n=1 Tax=Tiliqua scincoides TaxID=71010 RepID=UPI0034620B0F